MGSAKHDDRSYPPGEDTRRALEEAERKSERLNEALQASVEELAAAGEKWKKRALRSEKRVKFLRAAVSQRLSPPHRFYAEGNKGADYIDLRGGHGEGVVELHVGFMCTVVCDHLVPVEFLAALVAGVTGRGSIEDFIRAQDWDPKYIEQLCAKVRKV